jgi:hypothetical protein
MAGYMSLQLSDNKYLQELISNATDVILNELNNTGTAVGAKSNNFFASDVTKTSTNISEIRQEIYNDIFKSIAKSLDVSMGSLISNMTFSESGRIDLSQSGRSRSTGNKMVANTGTGSYRNPE